MHLFLELARCSLRLVTNDVMNLGQLLLKILLGCLELFDLPLFVDFGSLQFSCTIQDSGKALGVVWVLDVCDICNLIKKGHVVLFLLIQKGQAYFQFCSPRTEVLQSLIQLHDLWLLVRIASFQRSLATKPARA